MTYSYQPHHYEEFEEGQTFESSGRTVTETDVVNYAAIDGDWTELHTNTEYADEQPFGQRVVHGPLTFSIAMGLAYRCGFMERTVLGFLGMETMDFPKPVFIDDTVYGTYTITNKRDLESRPNAGVVSVQFDLHNQHEELVFDSEMKFLVKRRSGSETDNK